MGGGRQGKQAYGGQRRQAGNQAHGSHLRYVAMQHSHDE
jgi:hypothetical protein